MNSTGPIKMGDLGAGLPQKRPLGRSERSATPGFVTFYRVPGSRARNILTNPVQATTCIQDDTAPGAMTRPHPCHPWPIPLFGIRLGLNLGG